VDPEDHRQFLGVLRRINIEDLEFVRFIDVWNVPLDILALSFALKRESEQQTEDLFHDSHPFRESHPISLPSYLFLS
jgi:hypothetical protein